MTHYPHDWVEETHKGTGLLQDVCANPGCGVVRPISGWGENDICIGSVRAAVAQQQSK